MVLILIFAAWGKPPESVGFFNAVYNVHWYLTLILLVFLAIMLKLWFEKDEIKDWLDSTWDFAKKYSPCFLRGLWLQVSSWVARDWIQVSYLRTILQPLLAETPSG
ncbi:hypothetical protein N752_06845 [Desulforamulus aquiferis]|nr:hypothetical protein N752_06845 [Desulforamulus aquiferis]